MEFIIFLIGVLAGIIITRFLTNKDTICGIIEIDHFFDEVKIHISSEDLRDVRKKQAVFKIDHNGKFSRD